MEFLSVTITTVFSLLSISVVDVAADVTITAVNGVHNNAYDFTYHTQTTDWLTAFDACAESSQSMLMSSGSDEIFNAFLAALEEIDNQYTYDIDIWTGFYKQNGNEDSYNSNTCDVVTFEPDVVTTGLQASSVTCVKVRYTNATSEPTFHEAPCDEQYGFVCVVIQDLFVSYTSISTVYPTGVYINEKRTLVTNGMCRYQCFIDKYCLACTFYMSTWRCHLALNLQSAQTTYTITNSSLDDAHTFKRKDTLQVNDTTTEPGVENTAFQCLPQALFETTTLTNALTTSTAATGQCECHCAIYRLLDPNSNTSQTKRNAGFAKMLEDLKWNRKSTSKYYRKLHSATDSRISARTIGWTGVIVLILFALAIAVLDANRVHSCGAVALNNIRALSRKYQLTDK